MKKLTRPQAAPDCLLRYRHGKDVWEKISKDCKNQIWIQLERMQGAFCAYCEDRLRDGKHIEHFYKRNTHVRQTFEWSNLFAACSSTKLQYCAGYKDAKGGSLQNVSIIKPDIDTATDYLICTGSGHLQARSNLNETDRKKAETTIEKFNLNHPNLQQRRNAAICSARNAAKFYYEAYLNNPVELNKELSQLIEGQPFQTWLWLVLSQ